MQLNAEGFVDEVLFRFLPKDLNDILKDIEEGWGKAHNLLHRSVKYGLSLQKSKRCIEHCLNQTSKLLGKPIEQIIKEPQYKNLEHLLNQEDLEALKLEMIKFTKFIFINHSDEFRDPNDLNCEKITRLHITMWNFYMQNKFSNVFSSEVIDQASDFFSYIIDKNKIDKINFICDMIDNLSLDNITDDISTTFAKLVIFLNDFMFRKNNIIEFIDKRFNLYNVEILFEISKGSDYPIAIGYKVNKQAMGKYAKFLLDNLQLILGYPIDLNSNKKINELLDQEILDIFKEEAIAFIINYGSGFYDNEIIKMSNRFNDNFFDIETPIYLISNERIEQAKQINILIDYFNLLSHNNQSQIFPSEIININQFLNEISNVNYDQAAINSILNFNSTKNLLPKIGQLGVTITINEVYSFLSEFNKNFPYIMYPINPIPQQEISIEEQNLK